MEQILKYTSMVIHQVQEGVITVSEQFSIALKTRDTKGLPGLQNILPGVQRT